MINENRLVRTLQELVRIPSHDDCSEISKYVEARVRELGFKPEVDEDGNIVVKVGHGRAFLLNAHMDTVGVKDYPEAYSAGIKDNRVYGRGSSDDKSGVATMLEVMHALNEKPAKNQVIFAFTVWEESMSGRTDGASKIAKRVKASHGLVLESTAHENNDIEIHIGCKGRFQYTISIFGKAAHSGSPENGVNSIYLASKLIEKLKNLETKSLKITNEITKESKFSITQIDAMEGVNIIPAKCNLTADYRALPGEEPDKILERIKKVCKEVVGDGFDARIDSTREAYVEHDAGFLGVCEDSINATGFKPKVGFTSGWVDAQYFSKEGIKMFNIGPGTSGQAHHNPEYCWIPGLVKGTEAILNIIRKWDDM